MVTEIQITMLLRGSATVRTLNLYATEIIENMEKMFGKEPVRLPTTKGSGSTQQTQYPVNTGRVYPMAARESLLIDLLRVKRGIQIRGKMAKGVGGSGINSGTTLNGDINSSVNSLTVTSGTLIDNGVNATEPGYIQIDNELIQYTGVSTNTVSGLTRGYGGTTASAHTSGAEVGNASYHYRQLLKAFYEKGGTMRLFLMGNAGASPANPVSGSPPDGTESYRGNIEKLELREKPEDNDLPTYEFTIMFIEGINLGER